MSERGPNLSMCQPCWDHLREQVRKAGLEPLTANSGAEAIRRIKEGREPFGGDPLLILNFILAKMAFDDRGPVPGCPVCYLAGSIKEPTQSLLGEAVAAYRRGMEAKSS